MDDIAKKVFRRIASFINKEHRMKIKYKEQENSLGILGLNGKTPLEQALFSSMFELFKQKKYKLDKEILLKDRINNKVESYAKDIFKAPMVHRINNDFLFIVSSKFANSFNEEGIPVKACQKNDIIVLDYKLQKFYCQSSMIFGKFKRRLIKEGVELDRKLPKKINSIFLKKLIMSKKLDINEIELHNLKDTDIFNFYLKAGSKSSKINKKIRQIVERLVEDFKAYNLKSLVVSTKDSKDRLRISIIPEGLRTYKIIVLTKNPNPKLRRDVESILREEGVGFNEPVIFEEEPIEDSILQEMKKKSIPDYDFYYRDDIKKWDKNKLLFFHEGKLKLNEDNLIGTIENLTGKDFFIKKANIIISGKEIKGYILTRRKDQKQIFFLINKNHIDLKKIELLSSNKKIPFFYIETKDTSFKIDPQFIFTMFNHFTPKEFSFHIDRIIDNQQLFKNLENNFQLGLKRIHKIKLSLANKNSQKKGQEWETICDNLLNYVFKNSFPLGKSYLPDGITFFNSRDSIIWDAKALNGERSYLNESIKTKNRRSIKDTFYIKAFKEEGFTFDYYAYLTIGVDETDFKRAKKNIDRYLKKKLIDIKVICLTDIWMKGFFEYFSNRENLLRIHKNIEEFLVILRNEFDKNNYINVFDAAPFDKIGKTKGIGDLTDIRRKIRKEMNK